jgi:parallel beta-helix repeat protein
VVLVGTTANVVRGLRIADNTSGGIFVDGFAAGGSSANRLAGNLVRGNGNDGISLRGTTDNVVRGNVAAGNRGPGVVLQYASGNSLDANLLTSNAGPGVFLYTLADGNGLALNRVVDNELAGVLVSGGSRNRVVANTIRRNAGGIDVASGQRPLGSDGNVLAQNAITGNAGDGISVYGPWEYVGIQYPGAAGTVVRGNEAAGNGDDGIDVRSAATTITGNGADRNVDLGIDAVPGVTDGGGNHAAGNGNPLQCVGVTCS